MWNAWTLLKARIVSRPCKYPEKLVRIGPMPIMYSRCISMLIVPYVRYTLMQRYASTAPQGTTCGTMIIAGTSVMNTMLMLFCQCEKERGENAGDGVRGCRTNANRETGAALVQR